MFNNSNIADCVSRLCVFGRLRDIKLCTSLGLHPQQKVTEYSESHLTRNELADRNWVEATFKHSQVKYDNN